MTPITTSPHFIVYLQSQLMRSYSVNTIEYLAKHLEEYHFSSGFFDKWPQLQTIGEDRFFQNFSIRSVGRLLPLQRDDQYVATGLLL